MNLRDAREAIGMTQGELAASVGTSQSMLSIIEGGRKVSEGLATELSMVLGVPVCELFPVNQRQQSGSVDWVCGCIPLGELDERGVGVDLEAILDLRQRGMELKRLLDGLPTRSRRIVAMLYGLDGGSPSSFSKTAREEGVSPERIRQVAAGVLRYLRHPKRKERLA